MEERKIKEERIIPNLAYSVSLVNKCMHVPYTEHLEVVNEFFIISRMLYFEILFQNKGFLNIVDYLDANWESSSDNIRSTIGSCKFLWGNLVTWNTTKSIHGSYNSVEVEYRITTHTCREFIRLQK